MLREWVDFTKGELQRGVVDVSAHSIKGSPQSLYDWDTHVQMTQFSAMLRFSIDHPPSLWVTRRKIPMNSVTNGLILEKDITS